MKFVLLGIVAVYGLLCLLAFVFQARLLYFPSDEDAGTPRDVGLDYHDVEFATATGRRLHGWFAPAAGATKTLLYFHGNAGNITHRLHSIRQFVDLGLNVMIFDYAGYGRSGGRPSEKRTYEDARAAWFHLVDEEGIDPDSIILFGRSLGAAVAIELATEAEPHALIVESAFTSVPELAARLYPWLPVRYLARYRYNSMGRVRHLRMPKLFVHSLDDEIVPFGMGKRLYNRAARPKTFVRIRGGHNDGFAVSEPEYETSIREFLENLSPSLESDAGRSRDRGD